MNRNAESRFAINPQVSMSRSSFDRSSVVKTSFNVGDLIPFFIDEVLPGDTFKVSTSKLVRMQTLLTPIMDDIYLDTFFYFVPNRLVWSHWQQFNGENTESAWIPQTEYTIPQISPPSGGWSVGTIADYFGIPTGVDGFSVTSLPFRAYALICNEWFRDQNLTDPLNIPVDDTDVIGVNTGSYITDCVLGGLPFKAAKCHDYFTSCLPSPQKGPDVTLPVSGGQNLPVYALSDSNPFSGNTSPIRMVDGSGAVAGGNDSIGTTASGVFGLSTNTVVANPVNPVYFDNLYAVDSGDVSSTTINQLRTAFQIQKLYERDARGGTRYIELLKSHFGVTSPDSRLQRPEYLGGSRVPITINQVVQTSGTSSGSTPQGNTAAFSLTADTEFDFTQSFVEHGFVVGLMVARYKHTYQDGIERFWSRKGRFDYYWPTLANIGEQAVKNREIFVQGTSVDDEVFGYQEAWADYRYKPSRVSGEMRSKYAQSLDVWHLADDYATLPSLSDSWIREDLTNVDRVLAVTSSLSHQLFADLYIKNTTVRPMPVFSIPGLVDHH